MKALLIEPDPRVAEIVAEYLQDTATVLHAADGQAAIYTVDTAGVDAIITEHAIGITSGFAFLYELRSYPEWQHIPIILFSHTALTDDVLSGDGWRSLQPIEYVYKPHATLNRLKEALLRSVPVST